MKFPRIVSVYGLLNGEKVVRDYSYTLYCCGYALKLSSAIGNTYLTLLHCCYLCFLPIELAISETITQVLTQYRYSYQYILAKKCLLIIVS